MSGVAPVYRTTIILFLKYFIIIDIIPSIGLVSHDYYHILAAGGFAYALAVLGLRWRRASSEEIVCAAVLDTFFFRSVTSSKTTSLIGTVVCNAVQRFEKRASLRAWKMGCKILN